MPSQVTAKRAGSSKKTSKLAAEAGPLSHSRTFALAVIATVFFGLASYTSHCRSVQTCLQLHTRLWHVWQHVCVRGCVLLCASACQASAALILPRAAIWLASVFMRMLSLLYCRALENLLMSRLAWVVILKTYTLSGCPPRIVSSQGQKHALIILGRESSTVIQSSGSCVNNPHT